jgi:hypothetical protein
LTCFDKRLEYQLSAGQTKQENEMKSYTYYVSANPECYGSDATEAEARAGAKKIAARAREEFPSVEFVVGEGRHQFGVDDDLLAEVQDTINDNWTDWICQ